MKTRIWLLSLGVLGCVASAPLARVQAAEAAPVAAKSQADLDYEAAVALWRTEPPAGVEYPSKEHFQFADKKLQEYAAAVRAFGEKYPHDPRRYEGWVQASYTAPSFIKEFKPGFDTKPGWANIVADEAKVVAYRTGQLPLLEQVLLADDSTMRQRGGGFFAYLVDSGTVARLKGGEFDIRSVRPLVDKIVAKFGDERALPVVEQYADGLRRQSPEAADVFEAELKGNPVLAAAMAKVAEDRRVAAEEKAAADKVRAADLGSVTFTAADGREVDLAALRGKVVLVDFWATWCGPCIAELPTIKKVYAEYHAKGFEIIGITLENPGFRPTDTEDQKAAKLAAARQKLLAFTTKNEMPWPQHFDGLHFKNEFAVKFGINAIPAMFLLDKEGRVASADARGEKLESEVRRLLGL